jgi:hypothetical protein
MVTDVKKIVENATTLILTTITALMDSADQDAIYVCKINISFKNNQLLSQNVNVCKLEKYHIYLQ